MGKVTYRGSSREEVVITGSRRGHGHLNSTLNVMGKHPSGLCSVCQQPETVEHILINCRKCARERKNRSWTEMHLWLDNNIYLTFFQWLDFKQNIQTKWTPADGSNATWWMPVAFKRQRRSSTRKRGDKWSEVTLCCSLGVRQQFVFN